MKHMNTIDVETKVTRMETPEDPERDTAQALVEKVMAERRRWIAAWHNRLFQPDKATVHEIPTGAIGWPVANGSCLIRIEERVIAKFLVRFREDLADVEFEVEWPREEEDVTSSADRHRVVYENHGGLVDYACEELGIEGTAGTVEEMKRRLTAAYGFRFDFERV